MLIDTHVHLNFDSYAEDLDQVAGHWRQAGITQVVHACCHPAEFPQLQAVANRFPEVFLAVGLHPLEAGQWDPSLISQMERYALEDPRVVAIGETGLDFYKSDPDTIDRQYQAFAAQVQLAQRLDLALIVHCRDAAVAARDLLDEWDPTHQLRVVMHCWSGSPEETGWFVERGCYISFSGIVTFKSARTVHASVLEVPLEQLLVETDCPFLAPTPHRGQRNEPAHVVYVAKRVAELRGLSLEDVATATTANAQHLFRLTKN